jgi:hypothetical protein
MLNISDWSDALVYSQTKHSKRSTSFKRAKRAKVLYIGLDHLIFRQFIIVESGKINIMRLV